MNNVTRNDKRDPIGIAMCRAAERQSLIRRGTIIPHPEFAEWPVDVFDYTTNTHHTIIEGPTPWLDDWCSSPILRKEIGR